MKMKTTFATIAIMLLPTMTQAETIYVTPNSATPWHSKAPFSKMTLGSKDLLELQPINDRTMIILAKEPEFTIIESTNVLIFDAQNNLLENLQVVVTPFGRPHITMRQGNRTYYCSMRCILAAKPDKNGIGDADSLSVTRTWVK